MDFSKGCFSVAERRREKQISRERDAACIANGEITAAAIRDRNNFFFVLDPSKARVAQRRLRIKL